MYKGLAFNRWGSKSFTRAQGSTQDDDRELGMVDDRTWRPARCPSQSAATSDNDAGKQISGPPSSLSGCEISKQDGAKF